MAAHGTPCVNRGSTWGGDAVRRPLLLGRFFQSHCADPVDIFAFSRRFLRGALGKWPIGPVRSASVSVMTQAIGKAIISIS
jgi:hypothetical protein